MPDLVMRKILEDCDFCTVLVVRKVCRALRDFIDNSFINSSLKRVHIDISIQSIILKVTFSNGGKKYKFKRIQYQHKYEDDCKMEISMNDGSGRTSKEILFENTSFVQLFCDDLERILRANDSIFENISVNFRGGPRKVFKVVVKEECSKIYGIFEKVFCLKNRRKTIRVIEYDYTETMTKVMEAMERSLMYRKLKVASFHMYPVPRDIQFMNIVNNIDATCLKKLEVNGLQDVILKNGVHLGTEIIEERIKWENMKFFCLWPFITSIPVQKLAHIPIVKIKYETISAEDILYLKEVVINSPATYRFTIGSKTKIDVNFLIKVLGPLSKQFYVGPFIWCFEIPGTRKIKVITCNQTSNWLVFTIEPRYKYRSYVVY
ncbi:hypothetical protein CAEBREN_04166 [Caenorhabditis brenneri]|uniref:F-box domain-containing protein n=1 Tax=Caenorhabditis brenneri TaxID=135651 RepID=G0PH13_CAEBE|nr:hypothetical protein CAEBREN_04166 [Caenorhabditis brenneri]